MKYSKAPLDYCQILSLLKSRGLLIKDKDIAINHLKVISYFRFANYLTPMECDKILHVYKPNSYFENAIRLYYFDKELRGIIFDAIQSIEIALRSKVTNFVSLKYGAFWFMEPTLFKDNIILINVYLLLKMRYYEAKKTLSRNIIKNILALIFLQHGKLSRLYLLVHYQRFCQI